MRPLIILRKEGHEIPEFLCEIFEARCALEGYPRPPPGPLHTVLLLSVEDDWRIA
jgi:hypothetical protein